MAILHQLRSLKKLLVNPFKKDHVDHFEKVHISLENAERHSSFTAHSQRIADHSALIDKTVEAGTQINGALNAHTVEGLRAEIDHGMPIKPQSLHEFHRLIF